MKWGTPDLLEEKYPNKDENRANLDRMELSEVNVNTGAIGSEMFILISKIFFIQMLIFSTFSFTTFS